MSWAHNYRICPREKFHETCSGLQTHLQEEQKIGYRGSLGPFVSSRTSALMGQAIQWTRIVSTLGLSPIAFLSYVTHLYGWLGLLTKNTKKNIEQGKNDNMQNLTEWMEVDLNGLNGLKWTDMARRDQSGSQQIAIDGNGPMWTEMDQVDKIGLKGTKVDLNGLTQTKFY